MAAELPVFDHRAPPKSKNEGLWDIVEGFKAWRLWAFLGLQDIRARYRRSLFGPLWLALGLGVTIAGIGLLYAQILKINAGNFVPFLAIGLLIWNLIAAVMTDATTLFQAGSGLITSVKFPYTTLSLRSMVRNLIVMVHCIFPVIIAFFIYKYPVSLMLLWAIPGLLLLLANLYWISIAIALICVRFRDMGQMVIYGIGLAIFVTPVIWQPSQLRLGSAVLLYNPLYHLLSLVRAPVFYRVFPVVSWVFCTIMLVVGGSLTAFAFVHYRRRIVHWI